MNDKWEYKVVEDVMKQSLEWLNLLGLDGWELVAVNYRLGYTYYFKRKIVNHE